MKNSALLATLLLLPFSVSASPSNQECADINKTKIEALIKAEQNYKENEKLWKEHQSLMDQWEALVKKAENGDKSFSLASEIQIIASKVKESEPDAEESGRLASDYKTAIVDFAQFRKGVCSKALSKD